jgi:predicted nuclease of predicted toxin-antitoxin system
MRLLLDECVPRPLKRDFVGHEVSHVRDLDWSGKRNGEILDLMVKAGFQVFITVDRNLEFQQNIQARGLGVVVMIARTNRRKDLEPLVPKALALLPSLHSGQLVRVTA